MISEYAPGRSIVVNKKTYIIGGLYRHTDSKYSFGQTAQYLSDANYVKRLVNTNEAVSFSCGQITKKCVVFPAMMKHKPEWNNDTIVAISKESLKDAKPFAVKQITDSFLR